MKEMDEEKAKRAFYALSHHINDNTKNIETHTDLVAVQQKMIRTLMEQMDRFFDVVKGIHEN